MDIRFVPDFVPHNAPARACRWTVLSRILTKSKKLPIFKLDAEVVRAVNRVIFLWRRQLLRLRDLGWSPMLTKKFQYARNCEPSVVSMKPAIGGDHSRFCNLMDICPWCWCRQRVLEVYSRLQVGLARAGMVWEKGRREYPLKLALSRTSTECQTWDDPGILYDYPESDYQVARGSVGERALGTLGVMSVSPRKASTLLHMAFVALLPLDYPTKPKSRVVMVPSTRNLGRLVAEMCPYPRGLLLGKPEVVLPILVERKGRRLLRASGVFANTDYLVDGNTGVEK